MFFLFFFTATSPPEIYTLSLHDALPIFHAVFDSPTGLIYPAMDTGHLTVRPNSTAHEVLRSEEHTSELQSHSDLVCRLLLEKKKNRNRLIDIHMSNTTHSTSPDYRTCIA